MQQFNTFQDCGTVELLPNFFNTGYISFNTFSARNGYPVLRCYANSSDIAYVQPKTGWSNLQVLTRNNYEFLFLCSFDSAFPITDNVTLANFNLVASTLGGNISLSTFRFYVGVFSFHEGRLKFEIRSFDGLDTRTWATVEVENYVLNTLMGLRVFLDVQGSSWGSQMTVWTYSQPEPLPQVNLPFAQRADTPFVNNTNYSYINPFRGNYVMSIDYMALTKNLGSHSAYLQPPVRADVVKIHPLNRKLRVINQVDPNIAHSGALRIATPGGIAYADTVPVDVAYPVRIKTPQGIMSWRSDF